MPTITFRDIRTLRPGDRIRTGFDNGRSVSMWTVEVLSVEKGDRSPFTGRPTYAVKVAGNGIWGDMMMFQPGDRVCRLR